MEEDKLKDIIVAECSTDNDESESKFIIVNEAYTY